MNIKEFVQNTVRRALARYESTRPAPTLAVTSKTLWSGTLTGGGTISLNENDTNYDVIEIFGYVQFSSADGTTSLLLLTYYTDSIVNGAIMGFSGVNQPSGGGSGASTGEGVLVRTNNRTITSSQANNRFTFTRVIGRKYVQST